MSVRVRDYHPILRIFPDASTWTYPTTSWSYNPESAETDAVWAVPRSLATTWGIISYFLLLGVMRCFSSPRSPTFKGIHELHSCGLPHSEINGSMAICAYPMLIAAYHVLLRL